MCGSCVRVCVSSSVCWGGGSNKYMLETFMRVQPKCVY